MKNSFGTLSLLTVGERAYRVHRLDALEKHGFRVSHLPFALRILLENLLRCEDGRAVTADQIEALARWEPKSAPSREIAFMPARVLLQDFTGVPAVVDLAAMRDAIRLMGGDPRRVNPLMPAELVIDHSVQVDAFGTPAAFATNARIEFERNRERYEFLRWGQTAFDNLKVVPPDTGIVHQVNLEALARVVMTSEETTRASDSDRDRRRGAGAGEMPEAYPDTVVGADSHTTMINGLGVLGWGVGGIEAEAAMLGQPLSMLIPQVVGFRLTGALPEGATATDAVLTVTERLRRKGVVGRFVEFFGPGLDALTLADRATIANMAPEYGATCAIFPVDNATLAYLELTGRTRERIELVETYMKEQGLFGAGSGAGVEYTEIVALDLSTVEASLAGPKRPQDRVRLGDVKTAFLKTLPEMLGPGADLSARATVRFGGAEPRIDPSTPPAPASESRVTTSGSVEGARPGAGSETVTTRIATAPPIEATLGHGAVVIAAITSCTNTSNPSVMLAAGLVAKKAVEHGLTTRPWVKTSLAPGSKAVSEYLREAGLAPYLDKLGFNLVGYGCTTCIGNSGPLSPDVSKAIATGNLVAAAVLSGNRNFEGRVHPEVRANYLASPPLVVAYAIAGRVDLDLRTEPLGTGRDGRPIFLSDLWPRQDEIASAIRLAVRAEMFRKSYKDLDQGDESWRGLTIPEGDTYAWNLESTYVKKAPFFDALRTDPDPVTDIEGARALALFGDSLTTDHISPAGSIRAASPAGQYLQSLGVRPADFNSYGARRGNHEVMMRGTFANVRIKNLMLPGVEGGETIHLPDGTRMTIFDAATKYRTEGVPLIVIAGKEYGTGSSRDWAAKGPLLLGVRAVIAESFERIHRSNLVGMGIAPLEFVEGASAASLGLTGSEVYEIRGLAKGVASGFGAGREIAVRARREDGSLVLFDVSVRLDTPREIEYYRHGGILPYVLRHLLAG